jgi:hypothetical protein
MEAEDIIQQKEWLELTVEEKKTIEPLAADEQEFNLLKKMLLFAAKEIKEVPVFMQEVPATLHKAMNKPRQMTRSNRTWYYAAAALLVLAFAAWFVFREEESLYGDLISGPDPKGYDALIGQSTRQILPGDPLEITHYAPRKVPATIKDSTPIVQPPNKPPLEIIQPKYAAVSTLLKSDTALMAFITAVY